MVRISLARRVGPVSADPRVFQDAICERAIAERKRLLGSLTPVTTACSASPRTGLAHVARHAV
jgi:hypothetical protein